MPDTIHIVVDAIVGGAVSYLIWRFRHMETRIEHFTETISKAVTLAEHRESMRGVYSDINSLRERVARMEGPAR